jgi:hydroxymethylpyrimidine/phosphomethylpyrimidine kinase
MAGLLGPVGPGWKDLHASRVDAPAAAPTRSVGPVASRAASAPPARAPQAGAGCRRGECLVLTDPLLFMTAAGAVWFESPRIATRSTHGTGCTLASAAATGLAQGLDGEEAVERARRYVAEAIRLAPGFGAGHGPLAHGWTAKPFR